MNPTTKTVYEALDGSPKTVPTLIKVTGYKDSYIRTCLELLLANGKVRRHRAAKVQRMGRPPAMWERVATNSAEVPRG